jgi:hypothetical protein
VKGGYKNHQNLLKEIQLKLQDHFTHGLFIPLFSGLVERNGSFFRVGYDGLPDLLFMIPFKGKLIAIAIEVKSGQGKLRKEQMKFKLAWEARYGLYIVGRNPSQVKEEISEWIYSQL